VRRSEDAFARHTTSSLIFSKFVPGVGRLSGPVAGMTGTARGPFLLLNALGSLLWAAVFALVGYIPAKKLPIDVLLEEAAGWLFVLLALALIGNVVWKYVQRQKFIRSLRVSRMTVQELKAAIDRGEQPFVVDLRHRLEFLVNPRTVSTAVRIAPDELPLRHAEIPRDRPCRFWLCISDFSFRRAGNSKARPREAADPLCCWLCAPRYRMAVGVSPGDR